jgi:hypothetical protein
MVESFAQSLMQMAGVQFGLSVQPGISLGLGTHTESLGTGTTVLKLLSDARNFISRARSWFMGTGVAVET